MWKLVQPTHIIQYLHMLTQVFWCESKKSQQLLTYSLIRADCSKITDYFGDKVLCYYPVALANGAAGIQDEIQIQELSACCEKVMEWNKSTFTAPNNHHDRL